MFRNPRHSSSSSSSSSSPFSSYPPSPAASTTALAKKIAILFVVLFVVLYLVMDAGEAKEEVQVYPKQTPPPSSLSSPSTPPPPSHHHAPPISTSRTPPPSTPPAHPPPLSSLPALEDKGDMAKPKEEEIEKYNKDFFAEEIEEEEEDEDEFEGDPDAKTSKPPSITTSAPPLSSLSTTSSRSPPPVGPSLTSSSPPPSSSSSPLSSSSNSSSSSSSLPQDEFCSSVHSHATHSGRHRMSICTMINNEALYIEEWLEYHLLQKVDHFYLYNDRSTDNIEEVLRPYIEQGIVSLFYWNKNVTVDEALVDVDPKYTRDQRFALADCVYHHQQETEWLGIWDIDEFIYVTEQYTDFQDFIERYLNAKKRDYFQIPLTIFGPSDHIDRPEGLVIENYHWRTSTIMYGYNPKTDRFVGKAMYRSGCGQPVVHVAPSLPTKCEPTREWVDFEKEPDYPIHMNHYYSKSWADYKEKLGKWKFDTTYENFVTAMKGLHDVYDTDMNKHVKNVNRAIACTRARAGKKHATV